MLRCTLEYNLQLSRYILVTNKICQKSCCNMKDYKELDWVKNIEWQAVFDFNPNTFHDACVSSFSRGQILIQFDFDADFL